MKILIVSPVDQAAINKLQEDHDVLCAFNPHDGLLQSLIKDREVLVFRSGVSITRTLLAGAPNLRLLVRAGCGLDNLDLPYISNRGIKLSRIPEPAAQAVAELTFALMLALARNLREADTTLRQGHWAKHELVGHRLRGKILGIVGTGNIGTRVGQLGAALGMQPIGCVEHPCPACATRLRGKGIVLKDFDVVVSQADFLSIHVPLKESTYNLVDSRALARMKPGAFLINMARGGVVDEDALYEMLVQGSRLRGAALDVHKHEGEGKVSPLAALPNVLLTPHIGSSTVDTQREIGRRVVEIINSFAAEDTEAPHSMPMEQQILTDSCGGKV
jgi:phosphoglycerate dehydrogenase-like enzyme